MLCEVPLTKEQQAFATAHQSLVYKVSGTKPGCQEDEFYDVSHFRLSESRSGLLF